MLFIDLRVAASGGGCVAGVADVNIRDESGDFVLNTQTLQQAIANQHAVFCTHGFNVNRHDGIAALSRWSGFYTLPANTVLVGVLWPGDAALLRVIDYPVEGSEAIQAGKLLAEFLNLYGKSAASLSFVSHSLGVRMVLETISHLERDAAHAVLMASAIENDCLTEEYANAAAKTSKITIVSSEKDWVLELAYPTGNFVGQVLRSDDPNFKTALGRDGSAAPIAWPQCGGNWHIPDEWNIGHLDYLPKDSDDADVTRQPCPQHAPAVDDTIPTANPLDGWKATWTAAAASTQLTQK